jgi:hypothetical protein
MSLYHLVWFGYDLHRVMTGHATPRTYFYLVMGLWGLWRAIRWARRRCGLCILMQSRRRDPCIKPQPRGGFNQCGGVFATRMGPHNIQALLSFLFSSQNQRAGGSVKFTDADRRPACTANGNPRDDARNPRIPGLFFCAIFVPERKSLEVRS